MVTTEDGDALRMADLEGHEKGDGFNGVISSVNIVACIRFISTLRELGDLRSTHP